MNEHWHVKRSHRRQATAAHPGQVTMEGKLVLKRAGNAKTNPKKQCKTQQEPMMNSQSILK